MEDESKVYLFMMKPECDPLSRGKHTQPFPHKKLARPTPPPECCAVVAPTLLRKYAHAHNLSTYDFDGNRRKDINDQPLVDDVLGALAWKLEPRTSAGAVRAASTTNTTTTTREQVKFGGLDSKQYEKVSL